MDAISHVSHTRQYDIKHKQFNIKIVRVTFYVTVTLTFTYIIFIYILVYCGYTYYVCKEDVRMM